MRGIDFAWVAPILLSLPYLFTSARATAAPDEGDKPFVEILQSNGAIDGPAEGGVAVPRWERVRLELRVKNRLASEIRDLEIEVALVSAAGTTETEAAVIPGWSFREAYPDPVGPDGESYLRILHELPARRTSPPADEIAYRAHIKSFRLSNPDLDTAIRLLGSSHASDQLAALKSYELDAQDRTDAERDNASGLARALARAITELPEEPSASDALRLLFAVRALGSIQDPSSVHTLLELPGSRDGASWGRAVLDLATRMVSASDPESPRLRVLPSWAREKALLAARAEDVLEDVVRDTILGMGDAAVPSLLHEAHLGAVPGVRARAQRLLHALGRATVRSELSLRDRDARLQVIEVLGLIGSPDPVPALVDLLRVRDTEQKEAVKRAIARIGPPAVEPLVASLGGAGDEAILAVLRELGPRAEAELVRVAARYGITRAARESPSELLDRLRTHLDAERRARLLAELERALDLGREGSFTESFLRLDAVFAQDAELYMRYAKPIAETYLARAKRLYARGDYDAAVSTLRTGESIHKLEEAEALLLQAQLALVRGYLELDDLDKAEETLGEADPEHTIAEARALEAKLLAMKAEDALEAGDYGKARTLVDRARVAKLDPAALGAVNRRLLLAENLAIIIVLGLSIPATVLAAILAVRRRLQAAKLERALADDRPESPPRVA